MRKLNKMLLCVLGGEGGGGGGVSVWSQCCCEVWVWGAYVSLEPMIVLSGSGEHMSV